MSGAARTRSRRRPPHRPGTPTPHPAAPRRRRSGHHDHRRDQPVKTTSQRSTTTSRRRATKTKTATRLPSCGRASRSSCSTRPPAAASPRRSRPRLRAKGWTVSGVGNFRGVVPGDHRLLPRRPGSRRAGRGQEPADAAAHPAALRQPVDDPAHRRRDHQLPQLSGWACPTPSTAAGRAGLAALLDAPGRGAARASTSTARWPRSSPTPTRRAPTPTYPLPLLRLAPRLGRLAVITGRPAEIAVDYASLADVDRLVVLGHYGLERWEGGRVTAPADDPARRGGAHAGARAARRAGRGRRLRRGQRARDRRACTSLRRPGCRVRSRGAPLRALADELGLVGGARSAWWSSCDRPAATRATRCARSSPSSRPSVVVFIGDDLGDLPAFAAVESLRADGAAGAAGLQRVDRGDRGGRPRRSRRRRSGGCRGSCCRRWPTSSTAAPADGQRCR